MYTGVGVGANAHFTQDMDSGLKPGTVSTPKMSTHSRNWGSESGHGANLRRNRVRNPNLSW